ncbi:glucose 1-dehydrogenase [Chamaesiphon sp.]|uniref:glucose 1-dehydrogenase n=1 Tax=Chamaesiphon sp. TaxID=2814140 RepID=UPI0035937C66
MSYSSTLLAGQKALVTGGSSGIGAGIALHLAACGAAVVVNYLSDADAAHQIVAQIEAAHGEAFAIQANVGREEEVQAMFGQMCDRFGTIDILVNNSGIQKDAAFVEMSLDDWNKVIETNLTGQFLCAREAAKEFLRRGVQPDISSAAGKIICMSSVHQVIPWAGHVNYAASKGGVDLLMRTIAQELAPHKIRINSIAPGAIATPINQSAWDSPAAAAKLLQLIPAKRIGNVDDIGRAAVWLASDDSDYVTGTTLFVDGGMTLYPAFAENG